MHTQTLRTHTYTPTAPINVYSRQVLAKVRTKRQSNGKGVHVCACVSVYVCVRVCVCFLKTNRKFAHTHLQLEKHAYLYLTHIYSTQYLSSPPYMHTHIRAYTHAQHPHICTHIYTDTHTHTHTHTDTHTDTHTRTHTHAYTQESWTRPSTSLPPSERSTRRDDRSVIVFMISNSCVLWSS
jgi:hypothetical protein